MRIAVRPTQNVISGTPRLKVLQRKCACGGTPGPTGEGEACHGKKRQLRPSNSPAPSSINDPTSSGSEVPPIVHEVLRSPGQPLDAETLAFMEPRFGHDFGNVKVRETMGDYTRGKLTLNDPRDADEGEANQVAEPLSRISVPQVGANLRKYDLSQVRIHTDDHAAASARAVNALAYTVGKHIVFETGTYSRHTLSGKRLLAHELTHVVQQDRTGMNPSRLQRFILRDCDASAGQINPRAFPAERRALLQRKCACGGTPGLSGECESCRKKKLQRATNHQSTLDSQPSAVPPIVSEVLHSPGQPLRAATRAFIEPRFGHDFGRVSMQSPWEARHFADGWFPATGSIQRKCSSCATEDDQGQAKLPVSKPNDPLEQEADRFAEQVMQGHTPTPPRGAAPAVQRDALDEAVEETEQIDDNETERIDEEETGPQGTGTGMALAKREGRSPQALPESAIPRSGGRPLEPEVQHFMHERTGLDFAHVRIHADAEAAASASRVAARAYTVRSNIYFGRGEYEPKSREGRTLLAHELAHVVQQSEGQLRPRLKVGPLNISAAPPSVLRAPLAPPGNCIQGLHDAMQRAVKAWCDHPSGRACTAGESCGRLLQKIRRNQMCARNRRRINEICYAGGDVGHRIAELDARRAQATCMALFRAQCQLPAPVPVPAPVPAPATVPAPDQGFLDRMAAITGLTGTALIVYLIISEGSRLFPPRNLIPVL
jgi:hypothetical protein